MKELIDESGKEIMVDVFGGGATVALNCKNKAIIYNDKLEGLYNFFRVTRTNGEELKRKLDITLYCENEYIRCRDNWINESDEIERARMFYVATMQSQYHTVVMNNKKVFRRSSDYVKRRKTPKYVSQWRTNIEKNLPKCIEKFKEIEVWNQDALYCIDRCNSEQYALYIDPPYIKSTRSTKEDAYEHEYTDEDHRILITEA
ncbi:MAG: DNA adenine methylase [Romboutsia sp.]|uniref:DNA adenine methylase n=1 Tax=Romboutsia sp. TaxID=1965302 RepID=UPI003F373798